jgi:hypothetical protein
VAETKQPAMTSLTSPQTTTAGGVQVEVTPKETAAIGRLQNTLKKGGRWDDLSTQDRRLLGNLFHKVVEPLATFIFEGVGQTFKNVEVTKGCIDKLREAGGRVLFVEGKLRIQGRWKRVDLAEIDFRHNRIIVIDLTSLERAEHVSKTRAYKMTLQQLTGFSADAMEMRYVGGMKELLEVLIEAVV